MGIKLFRFACLSLMGNTVHTLQYYDSDRTTELHVLMVEKMQHMHGYNFNNMHKFTFMKNSVNISSCFSVLIAIAFNSVCTMTRKGSKAPPQGTISLYPRQPGYIHISESGAVIRGNIIRLLSMCENHSRA